MRSNVDELPGLNRVAAQLGASFIIVSNLLPYTSTLIGESLCGWSTTSSEAVLNTARPSWRPPKIDWDERVETAPGRALFRSGPVSFLDAAMDGANSHCAFIHADACAVAWHGGVSPCPPLFHTYSCFLHGRQKQMVRWEAGRLPDESLIGVWRRPEYVAFRDRVRAFDFSPCTDCGGCDMAETNAEDCFGSPHPACGDCFWARGGHPLRLA